MFKLTFETRFAMDPNDTKTRIIEAAIEVFLEKGYAAATIRDICARAEANVAGVNYHFGSKDCLYVAALERILASCREGYPLTEGLAEASSPEERLRRYIRNLMRLVVPEDAEHARRSTLLWRELDNPSPSFLAIAERAMRPFKDLLDEIIMNIVGLIGLETTRLCAASIIGQCYFYARNRAVFEQLFPEKKHNPHVAKTLAEHIYQFSLAGLEAARGQSRLIFSR